MPRTKSKPEPRTNGSPPGATAGAPSLDAADVLTLTETAAYLRVAEEDVLRMVHEQHLPARLIGREWRFLKPALHDWLRTPPPRSSKEALLAMAGKFKDDPFLEDIVQEAYRQRGRPITEDAE